MHGLTRIKLGRIKKGPKTAGFSGHRLAPSETNHLYSHCWHATTDILSILLLFSRTAIFTLVCLNNYQVNA